MNSGKTQAVWLESKRQSLISQGLPFTFKPNCLTLYIKIDWNIPKFKILRVWLTADLTDCEKNIL